MSFYFANLKIQTNIEGNRKADILLPDEESLSPDLFQLSLFCSSDFMLPVPYKDKLNKLVVISQNTKIFFMIS